MNRLRRQVRVIGKYLGANIGVRSDTTRVNEFVQGESKRC